MIVTLVYSILVMVDSAFAAVLRGHTAGLCGPSFDLFARCTVTMRCYL